MESSNNRVLVVGGAGYIGGMTTDVLLENGWEVTVFDNLTYEDRYLKPVQFVYGDIRDTDRVVETCIAQECSVVVLMAALVGDAACNVNQDLTNEINYLAIRDICEKLPADVRVVFMSTCSVYGNADGVVNEESAAKPLSSYASTKLKAEPHVLARDGVVFRLGTVYGVGDVFSRIRADLVVNTLTIKAFMKGELTVNGGEQWRPIISVRDVAGYVEEACRGSMTGVYVVAYTNTRIRDLAKEVYVSLIRYNPEINLKFNDALFQDERSYRVDTSKADRTFVFRPRVSVSSEVQKMYNLLQSKRIKDPENINYVNGLFLSHKRL